MQETANSARVFRFGVFEVDAATGELRKQGLRIRLQEQPYQLLLMLLERAGEVLSREEIRYKLWPPDTFVDFDSSLNTALRKLRQALGDSPNNPRFIETMARRGYRFIAPVHRAAAIQPVGSPGLKARERRVSIHKRFLVALAAVLVLGVVAGILYKPAFERSHTASEALPPPVPLTSYPGFQWSPSFSPDGTRVAFTWNELGKRAPGIFVKLIGPTDPVRLTSGEESDFAPAWSPDGRWIAFLRAESSFSSVVMLIPSLGGRARELARLQLHTARLFYPGWWGASPPFLAWSSNGKWLLALEQSDSERPTRDIPVRIVRISVDSGEKSPFLLSLDAEQDRPKAGPSLMKDEEGLSLSPDGKKLAFINTVDSPNTGVYIVTLTDEMMPAGPAMSLHFDKSRCRGIAWDTDGRSLIVSSDRRGSVELWRVPVSGSATPSLISVSDDQAADLAISKTGQRLAYTHLSYLLNIWRVDLTSARLKGAAAFITSARSEFHPSYSADGRHIAFESNRFGNEEIWVSDSDGSRAVQITSFGNAYAGSPRWSPDGRQIAFDSNATGQWNIYLVSSQGGKPNRLTAGSGSKIRPSWSQDGKWIYYSASGDSGLQIWKKAATGGAGIQITKNGGYDQMESPDGRYLYYLNKGEGALWRVPVNGGEEAQLAELGPDSQFTVGKHGVYFIASMDANTLKFLDYGTGSIKVLGTLPGSALHGLAVSPDEHFLLFAKGESGGSHLMLVERFR